MAALAKARIIVFRRGWSDSSPMSGYDWLWSQFREIQEDKVVAVWRAACELQLASNELAQLVSGEELEIPEKELAHELFAERHRERFALHVRLHVDPPVALGSGHRALVHAVSGQTFKIGTCKFLRRCRRRASRSHTERAQLI